MGDDVNDLAAMKSAGLSAAPGNARPEVRDKADVVTEGVRRPRSGPRTGRPDIERQHAAALNS